MDAQKTESWPFRAMIFVFRWTVGILIGLMILGVIIGVASSWNPAGGG